ncbi:hypothetical protein EVAR_50182_1 [Eumeta japonica]|uniref:Uncharacterized protein n=1 Tax=Eumeta variegata TaxID=151549 RepID=A0A4C1WWF8_EUMVA|nr:hypothetical protein EVAR_50182_1 [Eumeta japonica]
MLCVHYSHRDRNARAALLVPAAPASRTRRLTHEPRRPAPLLRLGHGRRISKLIYYIVLIDESPCLVRCNARNSAAVKLVKERKVRGALHLRDRITRRQFRTAEFRVYKLAPIANPDYIQTENIASTSKKFNKDGATLTLLYLFTECHHVSCAGAPRRSIKVGADYASTPRRVSRLFSNYDVLRLRLDKS